MSDLEGIRDVIESATLHHLREANIPSILVYRTSNQTRFWIGVLEFCNHSQQIAVFIPQNRIWKVCLSIPLDEEKINELEEFHPNHGIKITNNVCLKAHSQNALRIISGNLISWYGNTYQIPSPPETLSEMGLVYDLISFDSI